MNYLFLFSLLLLVFACSKTGYTPIEDVPEKDTLTTRVLNGANLYAEEIDVLVAFLWPERISTDDQRKKVAEVISTSRQIRKEKEAFLSRRLSLKNQFEAADCRCALDGICEESDTEPDYDLCEEIEENIYKNNQSLVTFYQMVEDMKALVEDVGGEWLKSNTDYPLRPLSRFSFSDLKMRLEVFGDYHHEEETLPYAYSVDAMELKQKSDYQLLSFTFPRNDFRNGELIDFGQWEVEVGITPSEATLTFQGELRWRHQGRERLGIIYWENPRR